MAHSPWAPWLCVNELLMPSEAWYQKSGMRGGEKRNEGAFKKWIDGGMCLGLTRLEHATVVATGSIISHARAAAWTAQPSLIKPSRLNCQTISERALSVRRSTSKIDTSILNTVRWDGDDSAYIFWHSAHLPPQSKYTKQMADQTNNINMQVSLQVYARTVQWLKVSITLKLLLNWNGSGRYNNKPGPVNRWRSF